MKVRAWLLILWIIVTLGAMGELGRIHYRHYQAVKAQEEMKVAVEAFLEQFVPRYVFLMEENALLKEELRKQNRQSLILRQ